MTSSIAAFLLVWIGVGAIAAGIYALDTGRRDLWLVFWTPLFGPLALTLILPRSMIAARRAESERLRPFDDENYQRLMEAERALGIR